MINALLMFAAAAFGFGGSPWMGFAICAPVAIVLSFPQHLDVLARYYGQPKTDIALMILMYFGLVSPRCIRQRMGRILSGALVEALIEAIPIQRLAGCRSQCGWACSLRNIGLTEEFLK